jgi:hypothetical protein
VLDSLAFGAFDVFIARQVLFSSIASNPQFTACPFGLVPLFVIVQINDHSL